MRSVWNQKSGDLPDESGSRSFAQEERAAGTLIACAGRLPCPGPACFLVNLHFPRGDGGRCADGDELLEDAHAINIFHADSINGGYPLVTDEAIIAANP